MLDLYYKRGKRYYSIAWIRIGTFLLPLLLGVFRKTKITKVEGSFPKKSGNLIVPHHEAWEDPVVLILAAKRRLNWVAIYSVFAREKINKTILKKVYDWCGIMILKRGDLRQKENVFGYIIDLIKKGEDVVIFPEGNLRSERKGKKFGNFYNGVMQVVEKAKKDFKTEVPIVPIGLNYKYLKNKKTVDVKIANKIIFRRYDEKALNFLEDKIIELSS